MRITIMLHHIKPKPAGLEMNKHVHQHIGVFEDPFCLKFQEMIVDCINKELSIVEHNSGLGICREDRQETNYGFIYPLIIMIT